MIRRFDSLGRRIKKPKTYKNWKLNKKLPKQKKIQRKRSPFDRLDHFGKTIEHSNRHYPSPLPRSKRR